MMPSENASLDAKYNVLRLGVISSNSVKSRTGPLINHLSQQCDSGEKRPVASLRAKAPVANKLISAIEIAKRDLSRQGHKVYQYSSLSSETVLVHPQSAHIEKDKRLENQDTGGDTIAGEDEDEGFEVMRQRGKPQEVPVLTVYLSLAPIKELHIAHGEQVE